MIFVPEIPEPTDRDVADHPVRRSPRVLVVAFQSGKQADGGLESLTQLIEGYAGVRLTVLSQRETAKNARWQRAGARVLVWPKAAEAEDRSRSRWVQGWRRVAWNFRTAWLLLAEGIEVAHVNDPHALLHTIGAARLLGIPVVLNIRDTKSGFTPREVVKWRWAFRLTQVQIVLSREMGGFWRRSLGLAAPRMMAIYSVLNFSRLRPRDGEERRALRERLGLPAGFVAGYVASFSEKKAQLRFIREAAAQLRDRLPAAQVWFLGDFETAKDPYAAACGAAARELDRTGQLRFRGYIGDMENWYPALDVVVVATQNEGLARCMIESVACGTPVVSFDVCSAREILEEGQCGFVVTQGDYAGLIAALARLAGDETERARAGARGAAAVRSRFDATANTARYVAVYQTLAGQECAA